MGVRKVEVPTTGTPALTIRRDPKASIVLSRPLTRPQALRKRGAPSPVCGAAKSPGARLLFSVIPVRAHIDRGLFVGLGVCPRECLVDSGVAAYIVGRCNRKPGGDAPEDDDPGYYDSTRHQASEVVFSDGVTELGGAARAWLAAPGPGGMRH